MSSSSTNNPPLSGVAQAFGMGRPGDVVEEEQPAMRAVALMSAEPKLNFGSPLDVPKFGKAPPLGIGRPAPVGRRSASISVKQVWSEENWKVSDPLEQVPLDFPLERTHREIDGATANEVASRISNALRLLSVCAEYDCDKAKAKCTTSDCVSFRIRLFAGGEDGLPVVVEVQRRNGSPSSFMRVCRNILNAAEGEEVTADAVPARKQMPPFMKGPISGMKCLGDLPSKVDHDAQVASNLAKGMELLRSVQKDTNVLGLENLCHLTDPLKTNPVVAMKACKSIIFDTKCTDIREEISACLQKDTFVPEDTDVEGAANLHEKAHHLSLVLLSNSLALTGKDGCLADAVKNNPWFSQSLILTLLDEMKSFETSANNAYEATCGLTALATCSDIARRVMEENAAEGDLQSAYEFGSQFHELLANESERALQALGKRV